MSLYPYDAPAADGCEQVWQAEALPGFDAAPKPPPGFDGCTGEAVQLDGFGVWEVGDVLSNFMEGETRQVER